MLDKPKTTLVKPTATPETTSAIRLEKTPDMLKKKVPLTKPDDTERVAQMQAEIEQLQQTITALNEELTQYKDESEENVSFKEKISESLREKLSLKGIGEFLVDNIKENLVGYLVGGVLAGAIASGIQTLMKARSLEDIKHITATMQAEALKEVKDSINSTTEQLNKQLDTVETMNHELTQMKLSLSKEISSNEQNTNTTQKAEETEPQKIKRTKR